MRPISFLRLVCLTVLALPVWVRAQYEMGVVNSNYAGIRGSLINPAAIAGSKFNFDFNVISGDVLFDNNFLYVPKGAVPAFGFGSLVKGIIHTNKYATYYDPADPNKKYNLTLSSEVLGPSFMVALGPDQAIGLTIANRLSTSIRDIPGSTGQNAFDYLRNSGLWNTTLSDSGTKLNGMNWLEYGFHYAAVLANNGTDKWKLGITLKYEQGIAAGYIKNTHLSYRIQDSSHLYFSGGVDYGRTDYDSYRHIHSYSDLNHGQGFGGDIGLQYIHGDVLKLGVSLMDVGYIDFNRNAAAFHLETPGADFAGFGAAHLKSNAEVDRTLSAVFYQGDSAKSQVGTSFRMRLPTTISFQADWWVANHFFVNASVVKGISHGGDQGAIQPDIYSITPRFESKWWEVSVPMSFLYYGEWKPRIGLAVRAGFLFFGGDAPMGLLGTSAMNATDFYAGVRFFVFNKNE